MEYYLFEVLAHFLFFILGISGLSLFLDREPSLVEALSSYLLGQFATVFLVLLSSVLGIQVWMAFTTVLVIAIACLIHRFLTYPDVLSGKWTIKAGAIVIIYSLVLVFLDLTIMSFDSYRYVLLAKQMSVGIFDSQWLLGYSLSLSALQSIPITLFDLDLFRSLVPVTSAIGFTIIALDIWSRFEQHSSITKVNVALCFFAFLTCYFVFFGSFYLIPNMLVGIWLGVGVLSAGKFKSDIGDYWLFFFFATLFTFSTARVEGFIFSLVFLPLYFASNDSWKAGQVGLSTRFYYMFLLAIALWFSHLYFSFPGASGDFYTSSKLLILFVLLACMFMVPWVASKLGFADWLLINSGKVCFSVGVILCIVLAFIYTDRVEINSSSFLENMVNTGFWGGFWVLLYIPILILPLILLVTRSADRQWFEVLQLALSFVLLLFVIFFFREQPLRKGFGDSSNRMMLHIFPTILFLYSCGVGFLTTYLEKSTTRDLAFNN